MMLESKSPNQVMTLEGRLRDLHEISMELSRTTDVDELCRRAVELGIERLGFDRLSIWFLDRDDPRWLIGTWGTDESGKPRDERGERLPRDAAIVTEEFYEGTVPIFVWKSSEIFDDRRRAVGRGDKAAAPLWDGNRVIGEFCVDSLITKREIDESDQEILITFARIVAHIVSLKRTEEALKEALSAKAALLSELQHRTRNSFSVINSLISLEIHRSRDASLKETLRKFGDRVEALTSLYGHLDMAAGNDVINLDEYLGRIAEELSRSYGADVKGITVRTKLEPMRIDLKRAISLGLIENELVTDAFKYAFPNGRSGVVSVDLARDGEFAVLAVRDDGIGLPPGFTPESSTGLGIAIVRIMCEELSAILEIGEGPGTVFSVRFKA